MAVDRRWRGGYRRQRVSRSKPSANSRVHCSHNTETNFPIFTTYLHPSCQRARTVQAQCRDGAPERHASLGERPSSTEVRLVAMRVASGTAELGLTCTCTKGEHSAVAAHADFSAAI